MAKTASRYSRLENESRNIKFSIHNRQLKAEKCRLVEFKAAVRIQSWFRGTRLRCYMKLLNKKAIIIQKHWRGVLGRKAHLNQLKAIVRQSELMYYNKKATMLQKVFRGWYVRRHIFDFYVWKKYFITIEQKNEALKKQVDAYWLGDQNPKVLENQRLLKILKYEHKKTHYLLSTDTQPGIYQQEKHPELAKIENWIKRMKPAVKGERIDKTRRFPLKKKIPPIPNTIQPPVKGPFKTLEEIYAIKNRPKIPLRMEDDLEGARMKLEEANMLNEGLWIHDRAFHIRDSKPCPANDYSIFFSTMHKDDQVESDKPKLKFKKDFQVPIYPEPMSKLFQKKYGDYSDVI